MKRSGPSSHARTAREKRMLRVIIMEKINYQSELEKIENFKSQQKPLWKPLPGENELVLNSEIGRRTYTDKKSGEEEERAVIEVQVGAETKTWMMGFGQTKTSAYGQLIAIAAKNGNSLAGLKVLVVVKNNGLRNDYTIIQMSPHREVIK